MEGLSRGPINRQHSDKPQVPKRLRSTCDRCTMLKVRCDKKKPRCERCESVQQPCVYGPYRWKGRSTRSHTGLNKSYIRSSGPVPRGAVESFRQAATQSTPAGETMISEGAVNALSDLPLFPALDTLSFDFQDEIEGIYIGLTDDDGNDLTSAPSVGDFMGPGADHVSHHIETGRLAVLSGSEPHPMLDSGISDSHFSSPGSWASRNVCPCASLTFGVLHEMYRAETTCGIETSSYLPSSDHILKINRAAVKKIHEVLSRQCTECHGYHSILLLVVAIMSKILSWYQTVFNRIIQYSPAKSPGDQVEPAFVTPIQFGDFELDMNAEQRITAQFLLCELEQINKVLALIKDSPPRTAQDGRDSMNTFVGAVCQFLSSNLTDLISNVDGFCVSRPSFALC
ncbi:uncharacterized protein BDW43DRAFT_295948 [Aspergillus alliaceus]|uniref:uncharacterized protein n=1 Tax=Petromyces alliaceus TaxID=209559 RepID=UPI0012A7581B|nr:uncharacterized protein BDW43DRAFT_295948 [Aspergillus alliaceus]KAB8239544.1 hypothetical protein BDW43DRAFT_295948 [Aspergillus alliaceus]